MVEAASLARRAERAVTPELGVGGRCTFVTAHLARVERVGSRRARAHQPALIRAAFAERIDLAARESHAGPN